MVIRRKPPRWGHGALLLATCLFAGPLAWMVLSSLKPATQMIANPYGLLPERWSWSNYPSALQALPFLLYLRNSLLICFGSVAGSVISCSLAAYAFARLQWPGRDLCFGVLITTLLLPWQVTMIPRFLLLRELGLYNSLAALIAPTFLADAFYVFLLRQFYRTIPAEISEAARIDGLGEWGVFWHMIIPLSKPALATVALFQFVTAWNDFNGPLLYLSDPQTFPLAYGLERFVSSYSDQTHLLLAASVMFTLPIVLIFLLTQRTFLKGIAATGIKS